MSQGIRTSYFKKVETTQLQSMDGSSPTVTQASKSKCEKAYVEKIPALSPIRSTFSSHTCDDLTKKMQKEEIQGLSKEVDKEVPHAAAMDKSSPSSPITAILPKSSPCPSTPMTGSLIEIRQIGLKSFKKSDKCFQEGAERDAPVLAHNVSFEPSVPIPAEQNIPVPVFTIATTTLSQPCIFPASKGRIFSVSPPLSIPSSLPVQQTSIIDFQQKKDKELSISSEERTKAMSQRPECEDSSFSTKISSMSRCDALAKKVQSKKEKAREHVLLSLPKKVSEECSLTKEPIFLSCVPFVDDLALAECPMSHRVRGEKGPCGLSTEQVEKAPEGEELFALDQFKSARRLQKLIGRGAPVLNIKYFPPNLVKQGHQIFIKNFKEKLALDPAKISRIATNKISIGYEHKNAHPPDKCPGKECCFELFY